MQNLQDFYLLRISEISNNLKKVNKRILYVSFSRLFAFLAIIFSVCIYTTHQPYLATIFLIVSTTGFLLLVKHHATINEQKKLTEKLLKINQNEIDCLQFNYLHLADGSEYINYQHPYSSDLNIFGKASLFQYINRAETLYGKNELAKILATCETNKDMIFASQQAVKEIAPKIAWRQDFQAKGSLIDIENNSFESLNEWLNEPSVFFRKKLLKYLMWLLPVCCIGLLVFGFFTNIYGYAEIAFFLLAILYFSKAKEINKIHEKLSRKHEILKGFSDLLKNIEKEEFQSEILKKAKETLVHNKNSAASQIHSLSEILNRMDLRLNILAAFVLNALYLADFWHVLQLEKWKATNKNQLKNWSQSIALFECYSSLGGFAFNNPGYTFPELASDNFELKATNIGHPLIPNEKRVCNNFLLSDPGSFIVLTGANMAGKSTFLRTIGVNMVLAMTGAPVCASYFKFYPTLIMTGISIKDSLYDNESYFYAELKRLKMIVDEMELGKSIFIFLDEILKGTNSNDKIKGSKAILEKFIRYNVSGIIATHDISLGELENLYPRNIKNHSFEVVLEDDKLFYDYKLHEGSCKNLNASYLMKKMGIIS